MDIFKIALGAGLLVAAVVAYQLIRSKKAVTVADAVAQAKADASAIKKS